MPIPAEHDALWNRLQEFRFSDPEARLDLPRRLARENGWRVSYAHRVLSEYRRFLFLAATGDAPVTPSDAVDQAWHLHLVYTESYWKDLCEETIGMPLHHGPTRGGADESAKYRDWYRSTLERYRQCFDRRPPRRIWPSPAARFRHADRFLRTNSARTLLMPRSVGILLGVLCMVCLVVALTLGSSSAPSVPIDPRLILAGTTGGLAMAVLVALVAVRHRHRPPGARGRGEGAGGGGGCGVAMAACDGAGCGSGCGGGGGCGGCGGG